MSLLKFFLYDWVGYNFLISQKIHLFFQNKFLIEALAIFTNMLGKFSLFPAHFALLLCCITYSIYLHKNNAVAISISYARSMCLFFINASIGALIVHIAKYAFHFPRPICIDSFAINPHIITVLGNLHDICERDNYSFPSGHTAYLLLFISSFWGVMSIALKRVSVVALMIMMLSRVVLGKHFLADTVYSCLIVLGMSYPLSKAILKHYFTKYEALIKTHLKNKYSRFFK